MIVFNLFFFGLACFLAWQIYTSPSRSRGRACAMVLTVVVLVSQCMNGKL